jgi:hypothetical protein
MEVFVSTSSVKLGFQDDGIHNSFCVVLTCGDVLMCHFGVSDQWAHTQYNFLRRQLRDSYWNTFFVAL